LINSAFFFNEGSGGILWSCLPYNINPRCSSHSLYRIFILLSCSNLFGKLRLFSPSFCFIIIITEHDGDNNEGIYKPRGRETAISSVRLPLACVCESYAEERVMNWKRRKSGGDRYQNSSRARRRDAEAVVVRRET